MVKGISRQVIVVHSPEEKLFEQAIFILKEGQKPVTEETLLREAQKLIGGRNGQRKRKIWIYGPVWAAAGALLTGVCWIISALA